MPCQGISLWPPKRVGTECPAGLRDLPGVVYAHRVAGGQGTWLPLCPC